MPKNYVKICSIWQGEVESPFPGSFDRGIVLVTFWNDLIQELEQIVERLELSVLLLAKVLQLFRKSLRDHTVEFHEGVLARGIFERSALKEIVAE